LRRGYGFGLAGGAFSYVTLGFFSRFANKSFNEVFYGRLISFGTDGFFSSLGFLITGGTNS